MLPRHFEGLHAALARPERVSPRFSGPPSPHPDAFIDGLYRDCFFQYLALDRQSGAYVALLAATRADLLHRNVFLFVDSLASDLEREDSVELWSWLLEYLESNFAFRNVFTELIGSSEEQTNLPVPPKWISQVCGTIPGYFQLGGAERDLTVVRLLARDRVGPE